MLSFEGGLLAGGGEVNTGLIAVFLFIELIGWVLEMEEKATLGCASREGAGLTLCSHPSADSWLSLPWFSPFSDSNHELIMIMNETCWLSRGPAVGAGAGESYRAIVITLVLGCPG